MNRTVQKNYEYKKFIVNENLKYFKPHSTKIEKTFTEEISHGLDQAQKCIAPRFFYDGRGSELFEKICAIPEYYLTRAEISILEKFQDELARYVNKDCSIVELGSGASVKTCLILDVFNKFQKSTKYFPIDISEILTESSQQLLARYDKLHITGIIDTYAGGLDFLKGIDRGQILILFLGSSYGNFDPTEGHDFLKTVYNTMRQGDLFLIGLDLIKDKKVLESAYDDSGGATAAFNLNMLSRINDEMDADFDMDNFEHHALYNQKERRIEMYIRSLVNQTAIIAKSGQQVRLKRGELIHTEYSYKFEPSQIRSILQGAGFEIKRMWQDEKKYFSLTLVSKI